MKPLFLSIFLCFSTLGWSSTVAANYAHYSTQSLMAMCTDTSVFADQACKSYIRGVVETWFLKDLRSVDPNGFSSENGTPVYCETIFKVSDDEWKRIVIKNIDSTERNFASADVMSALFKGLCE